MNKLTFGKYKNSDVNAVIKRDPNYIVWCIENIE